MPYKNFLNLLFNRLALETLENSKNAGNCVGMKKNCYEKLFWISFLFFLYFIYLFIYLFTYFWFFFYFPRNLHFLLLLRTIRLKCWLLQYINAEKVMLISTQRRRKRCWRDKQHNEIRFIRFSITTWKI